MKILKFIKSILGKHTKNDLKSQEYSISLLHPKQKQSPKLLDLIVLKSLKSELGDPLSKFSPHSKIHVLLSNPQK